MAKKGRRKRQTIRGMAVDADCDPVRSHNPDRRTKDASGNATAEKQPTDRRHPPVER